MDTAMGPKPDFIIAGAMKAGTTWLHGALNSLTNVTIPDQEVHWIDAGDPTVHPEFQRVARDGLYLASGRDSRWFDACSSKPDKEILLGLDSTTLFHSRIDMRAVAESLPDAKVIILLRDPVERAYSHYWHLVRTGRARYRFERELLYGNREILDRSIYVDQVRHFQDSFGNRVHFVCYERMFAEPAMQLNLILRFLNLSESHLETLVERAAVRSNPGRYPRWLGGWLLGSRILSGLERGRYARDVGETRDHLIAYIRHIGYWGKLACLSVLSAGIHLRPPEMKAGTRRALVDFLSDANREIDQLLGPSWSQPWYRPR